MTLPIIPRIKIKIDCIAAFAVTVGPILYFLPALLNHVVLAPYDGMLFNIPIRVAAAQLVLSGYLPLWNPYIFGGMPLLGAAQGGLLFPPNWFYLIFSSAAATDLMVVSTYMIAALGAYLFARRTRVSILGAVVTSIIWQAGGFLLAQISHINIVHTAAILPWVLWAMERYVVNGSRARGAVLAVIVAIQIFAGHQQTFVYSFLLVCAYAIVMALSNAQQRKQYLFSLAFAAMGILLAAVQILPTAELLRNSLRASATYEFFSSFSMPRNFVMTFLAPYVFGGGDKRLFRAPYIGQMYYTEYVAYSGVLAIMLALVALLNKPDKRTKFWTCVAVAGLLLALGSGAPMSMNRLIYFVPILNLFRVPARHLVEVHFALAVLAGRGITSLASMSDTKQTMRRVVIVAGSVFVLTSLIVTRWRPSNFRLDRDAPLTVLRAPELFMPILFAGLSAWAIWFFVRRRRGRSVALLAVLILDLLMWGQFSGWYEASRSIPTAFWGVPESVKLLRDNAAGDLDTYRILTTHESIDPSTPLLNSQPKGWSLWTEPDVYMMHGIQNAAGYDGFGLQRYSELAGQMKLWGEVTDLNGTLRSNSRELDLLNARYLVTRREQRNEALVESTPEDLLSWERTLPVATEKLGGFMFAPNDLSLPSLSSSKRLMFKTAPFEIDHLALVTNLSFAEEIPDGTIIAKVHLKATDGHVFDLELRAGVDTADWAYDRPDIHGRIRHKRGIIATNYDVSDAQYNYKGHTYVTSLTLPERAQIESGEIELENASPGLLLSVFRVSLLSGDKTYPLSREMIDVGNRLAASNGSTSRGSESDRWKLKAEGKEVRIYENAKALPRAWVAPEMRVLDENAILQVIRTGAFPDGTRWDPLRTALMETEPPLALTSSGQQGRAEIKTYEPNRIDLQVSANANSILVLSENDYPGWRAYIDGKSVEVLRVNYALRGVLLPAGDRQVSFVYRPWSVIGGLLISLLTMVSLILFCRVGNGRRRRDASTTT